MSAGLFDASIYEANSGSFHNIRVQPETLQAEVDGTANAAGAGPINSEFTFRVQRANGAIGNRARSITVEFTGTPPTGYATNQTYTIPIMTPALWNTALPGTVGTYLGVATRVISRRPESIR